MVNKNTVLILGAGASVDYGYPTGEDLTKRIWNSAIIDKFDKFASKENDSSYIHGLNLLKRHFFQSRSRSIDTWLAKPANRNCVNAGKLLIAYLISNCEKKDFTEMGFFRPIYGSENKIKDEEDKNKDWYRLLLNEMLTMDLGDFAEANNRLSIITFNYDRSLEYFLINALRSNYIENEEEQCYKQFTELDIIHVYGKVGDLPTDNSVGIPYGESKIYSDWCKRANNLKIIPEVRNKNDKNIIQIKDRMKNARKIYFIGFSFDKSNVELLGFPFKAMHNDVEIHGSVFGMERGEIEIATSLVRVELQDRNLSVLNSNQSEDCKCKAFTFFKRYVINAFYT